MTTPAWSVGMQRIFPGAYVDVGGHLHIDAVDACLDCGVEPTDENQQRLYRELGETARVLGYNISFMKAEKRNDPVQNQDHGRE